jgi:hypothetical protein
MRHRTVVTHLMDIRRYLEQQRDVVDRFLESVHPSAQTPPTTLHESMRTACSQAASAFVRF